MIDFVIVKFITRHDFFKNIYVIYLFTIGRTYEKNINNIVLFEYVLY